MNINKKDVKSIVAYIFTLVLIIFAYQGFYRFGFGSDTMIHYLSPLINIESEFTYGRYIPFVMELFLYKMGIILPDKYRYFFILHIFLVSLGAFIYQQVIMAQVKKSSESVSIYEEYFGRALLLLPFISTLFSEYLMFPECFVYSFYVLFTAIALYFFAKKKYVLAAIFMILGGCTYQVSVILCAIYALLYILIEGNYVLNIKMLVRGIIVSFSCLFVGLLNYESTRLMQFMGVMTDNPKPISSVGILDSIVGVSRLFWDFLKNGIGLLPVPFINLLVIFVITLLLIISHKKEKEKVFTFLFAGIVMFLLALAIPIIQSKAPRVIYTLYAALGCMSFLGYVQLDEKTKKVAQAVAVIAVMVQIFSCQQIAINHYISNAQDLACAQAVLSKINNYEEMNGTTVKEIAVCVDDQSFNYYENVYYTLEQINERAARNVAYSLLEYTNNLLRGADDNISVSSEAANVTPYRRRFKKSSMSGNKVRKKYFKDMNWDHFDVDEQVVIDGNTAFWCVY